MRPLLKGRREDYQTLLCYLHQGSQYSPSEREPIRRQIVERLLEGEMEESNERDLHSKILCGPLGEEDASE